MSARLYVPQTQTTIIAAYRYYYDNWQIHAHTPELRIVQQAGDDVDFRGPLSLLRAVAVAFFYATRYASTGSVDER